MSTSRKELKRQEKEQVRQKLKSTFSRMGIITFLAGLAAILVGYWLEAQFHAPPEVAVALVAICVTVVFAFNIWLMRKSLQDAGINIQTSEKHKK